MWFDVIRKYRGAVKKIQRLARTKILDNRDRNMFIIRRNLSYFDKLKFKMHTNSQIIIAYHWRKYKKEKDRRKSLEMAQEAEKQAKKAKKKSKNTGATKHKAGVKSTGANSKLVNKTKSSKASSSKPGSEATISASNSITKHVEHTLE